MTDESLIQELPNELTPATPEEIANALVRAWRALWDETPSRESILCFSRRGPSRRVVAVLPLLEFRATQRASSVTGIATRSSRAQRLSGERLCGFICPTRRADFGCSLV